MGKLDGKTAIITGARQGIWKGIAFGLAKEGAKILIAAYSSAILYFMVKSALEGFHIFCKVNYLVTYVFCYINRAPVVSFQTYY